MTRYLAISGLAIALAIAAPLAAQDVHVHGEGRLDIAIEGNRLYMALESPGADIVGFEYAARSADEKAAMEAALAQLNDPLTLMRFDPGADCSVERAAAEFETGENDHETHEEHEEQQHDDHQEDGSHGAFHAEYEIQCADISVLSRIEFNYFRHFGNAQSLDIVLIDGRGQRSAEIDRGNPVLSLLP